MSNKKVIDKPMREPDYISKRGVHYYFSPEWVRGTSGTNLTFGKIAAVKEKNGEVHLYMKNKNGGYAFIQGSIQVNFRNWFTDRSIDYILLGVPIEELMADEN